MSREKMKDETKMSDKRRGKSDFDPDELTRYIARFSQINSEYEVKAKDAMKDMKELNHRQSISRAYSLELPEDVNQTLWNKLVTDRDLNLEKLYCEVLYSLGDYLTFSKSLKGDSNEILKTLQDMFRFSHHKHKELLSTIDISSGPSSVLYMDLIDAKGLIATDSNGLSDPYVLMSIVRGANTKEHSALLQSSSVKKYTLTPIWKESFSFKVSGADDEYLFIEVWDDDEDSTFAKSLAEVRGTRGFRQLVRETFSMNGKDFMGHVKIHIKNIPIKGFSHWFPLMSKNDKKKMGEIHLKIVVGLDRDKDSAMDDFKNLLRLAILLEFRKSSPTIAPYKWTGCLDKFSSDIIKKFGFGNGLNQQEISIAEWMTFTDFHNFGQPISIDLLTSKFQSLSEVEPQVLSGMGWDDQKRRFWMAIDSLIDSFTNFFAHYETSVYPDKKDLAIKIIKLIELFKLSLEKEGQNQNVSFIIRRLVKSIGEGAEESFIRIAQLQKELDLTGEEFNIHVKIGQCLIEFLTTDKDSYHAEIERALDIDYKKILYRVYDKRYCKLVKPKIKEFENEIGKNRSPNAATSDDAKLYELFVTLKNFAKLSPESLRPQELRIKGSFQKWFDASILEWLIVAWSKARNFISKAVEKDDLTPIDEYSNKSSSVVDSLGVLFQVPTFWHSIEWPDADGKFTWIINLINEFTLSSILFINSLCNRLEDIKSSETSPASRYEISSKECIVLNNIECIRGALNPFCEKLNIDKIIRDLATIKSSNAAESCLGTVQATICDSINQINNFLTEYIESIVKKIGMEIGLVLKKGESNSFFSIKNELLDYLEMNFERIYQESKPKKGHQDESVEDSAYLQLFCNSVWKQINSHLLEIVENRIEKDADFFKDLKMLTLTLSTFFKAKSSCDAGAPQKYMENLLQKMSEYEFTSLELIAQYCNLRYIQSKGNDPGIDLGKLRFRVQYLEDSEQLQIEILNASNLKISKDGANDPDPYLRIEILPDELFPQIKFQTEYKKSTIYPLFDQTFSFNFSKEDISSEAYLHFIVMDKNYLVDDLLGESFLPFEQIPFTSNERRIDELPQTQLNITLPNLNLFPDPESGNSEIIRILNILESRTQESNASGFARIERMKQARLVQLQV